MSQSDHICHRFLIGSCLVVISVMSISGYGYAAKVPEYVWIEGEDPAAASFEWTEAGVEKSELLSKSRWLIGKERKTLPDAGQTVEYDVQLETAGRYTLWLRVGFEWVRPNVAWRFDNGDWTRVGIAAALNENEKKQSAGREFDYQRRTTNVKEVGYWNEVAWWNAGEVQLAAGKHRLHLRFTRTRIDNPVIAIDVIALVRGQWTPEGKLKPGEIYDGPEDREAAKQVYAMPNPKGAAERNEAVLNGLWQVARYDDPDMTVNTYEPVRKLPAPEEYELKWMGIEVPGDAWQHPELGFGHRLIFRTRVQVPAGYEGRGFKLHFSGTNWIVSVFVNGEFAGEHIGVWVPWDLDVSEYVRPGRINEIALAVKGSYYAFDPGSSPGGDINRNRNIPRGNNRWSRWVAPIYPSSKGDGEGLQYGIVNPVRLVAVGRVYAEDVFIKPSVRRKELEADVTIRNTTNEDDRFQVVCEAVYDRNNQVEKRLGPAEIAVPSGKTAKVTVKGTWENPKLWWPLPNPDLYRLRTRIMQNGNVIDVQEELFGFREVTVEGPAILINGVRRNFWNWVDVPEKVAEADDYERQWRNEGDRFMRFSHGRRLSSILKTRQERLEFYDRHGFAGRLCSMIDGMFINYNLLIRRDGKTVPNELVWAGFRRHVDQLTRAYRNHPSVIFYQIENELIYINGMNTLGGNLPIAEREMLKVYAAGKTNDPTRPYTVGGGGDLSKAEGTADPTETLEINCPHYPLGNLDWYPENAYTLEKYSTKITRWPWTRKKPWVVGESAYANSLGFGSYVGGPVAFRSQDDANREKAKFMRMLYGGYRWAGAAGWFPWDNLSDYEDGRKVFSDLCVIPRKQTHRLYAGRKCELLFKVMNDTFSPAPVTFEWKYEIGRMKIAGDERQLSIEPGYGLEQTIAIAVPPVTTRKEGRLTLKASQPGAADYVDIRLVPALPDVDKVSINRKTLVLDRSGGVKDFLEKTGVRFEVIDELAELKNESGFLIIGPNTLSVKQARGHDLLAFAAQGGTVLALEQANVISGGNTPTPIKTTTRSGGYAHPQALGTALFRDLGRDDLIDWAGDHPTYKNVYVKPARGGRSLVECGPELPYSALVEMPAGKGIIASCQLRVGAKLNEDPAADILFRNMLEYYAGYKPSTATAAVFAPDNPLLARKIEETGVLQAAEGAIEAALDIDKYKVAVIDATGQNLASLNRMKEKVAAFQEAGGWLMLCNVTPESIDGFNRLVGTSHLLRPFRVERVHLLDTNTPLAATIGDGDVMLYGTEWIAQWMGKRWVSGNTYTHCIDADDAGPFTYPPGAEPDPYDYVARMDDKDPYNFVNGMLNSDFWKYIQQIWVPEEGPEPLVFAVRRPESIKEIRIWNNTNYGTIEDIDVIFDGDESRAVRMRLPDSSKMVSARLDSPRTAKKNITLMIRTWRTKPETNNQPRLVGIDNVQFIRASRPSAGIFLDNVGGLVAFENGRGGTFLSQIKFMADEPLAENDAKKVTLLGTILQNMGVGTRGSSVAVEGLNVEYETLDITDYCNRFMYERGGKAGWFGRKGQDLKRLPLGRRHFADVMYHVVDFSTSPVPDCIMLGGLRGSPADLDSQVKGIPVDKKADVLFFMHAANVSRPISERDRDRINDPRGSYKLPEVMRYVLHYNDGQQVTIPVVLEKHIDHWLQENPQSLEGTSVAWTAKLEAVKDRQAVIYSMKAVNPRPDLTIKGIDILPGVNEKGEKTDRAVPAVIAITLGRIRK